jgi:hypothetical protein
MPFTPDWTYYNSMPPNNSAVWLEFFGNVSGYPIQTRGDGRLWVANKGQSHFIVSGVNITRWGSFPPFNAFILYNSMLEQYNEPDPPYLAVGTLARESDSGVLSSVFYVASTVNDFSYLPIGNYVPSLFLLNQANPDGYMIWPYPKSYSSSVAYWNANCRDYYSDGTLLEYNNNKKVLDATKNFLDFVWTP